jgi:tetratricopeptide (TPR) repeat protein
MNNNFEKYTIDLALDSENPKINYFLALEYDNLNQTAAAISYYLRCAERTENKLLQYECLLRCGIGIKKQKIRGHTEKSCFQNAINILPDRPEAYYLLAETLMSLDRKHDAYTMICIGENLIKNNYIPLTNTIMDFNLSIFILKKLEYAKNIGLEIYN